VQGLFEEYNGHYSHSATIPVVEDEENLYSYNDEPIFRNENGTKCIWMQENGIWWIGNCDEITKSDNGFAYMKDCKCPWPSINEEENTHVDYYDYGDSNCKKCTWSRFPSNNTLSCNVDDDDECQFGIGFLGAKYDLRFHWVGDKCYERIKDSEYNSTAASQHVTPSGEIRHQSSTARLRQLLARKRLPSSGKRCIQQGGVLKLRLRPPPRTIRCDYSKANSPVSLCVTKSGPSSNQPCIFPFTWRGKKYNGCATNPDDSSQRWCSTKVDSNGNHITGQRNWGYCDSKCPKQN